MLRLLPSVTVFIVLMKLFTMASAIKIEFPEDGTKLIQTSEDNLTIFDFIQNMDAANLSIHKDEWEFFYQLQRTMLKEQNNSDEADPDEQSLLENGTRKVEYCSNQAWVLFHRRFSTVHGWSALIVCMFGSVANVINIIVLTRKSMVSSTNAILTGLAITDLLVMIEYIPYCVHQYLWTNRPLEERLTWGWAVVVLFHAHFGQLFHTISILLTVTLAVWRYIAVSRPQNNVTWCSMKRARMAILGNFTLAIVCNIPSYLNISIRQKEINGNYLYIIGFSELSENTSLKDWNFWIYSVVLKLLPCVSLSVLSIAIMRELLLVGQRRAAIMGHRDDGRAAEAERQAERVTKMLLAILILFLVSEVPQGILGLLSAIPNAGFFPCYKNLGDVMDMLVLFNSAVNFILYCFMSQQFRTTFKKLCNECWSIWPSLEYIKCCKDSQYPPDASANTTDDKKSCATYV